MLRRSLVASAIVLAGTVYCAPKALAQSVPVPFDGTVLGGCVVGSVTPGVLGNNGNSFYTPEFGPGGSPAQVEIDCTGPGQLSVAFPVQTAGPTTIGGPSDARVEGSQFQNQAGQGSNSLPPINDVYFVEMRAESNGPQPAPGAYSFEVLLTITP